MEDVLVYQRAILAGLFIESNIPDENNKRLELIEEILSSKSYLFNETQLSLLRKAYEEILLVRSESGCNECWILSEAFCQSLNEKEEKECFEIISTGALIVKVIPAYLNLIHQKILLRKVI